MFIGEIFSKKPFEKFALVKEKRSTFFFAKKKKVPKKKLASPLLDRLVSMGIVYCKASSTLRERLRRGAELFAWRKGVAPLAALWGTLIVWRLFFWCADGAVFPPRANFIPTKCGKITALHPSKAYWGLNKTVGIFADPSMHHARSARLPYTLHNDKEPRAAKHPFAKRIVLRLRRLPRRDHRALRYTASTLASIRPARSPTSFCNFFLDALTSVKVWATEKV